MNTSRDERSYLSPKSRRYGSDDAEPYYSEPEDNSASVPGPSCCSSLLIAIVVSSTLVVITTIGEQDQNLKPFRSLWLAIVPSIFMFPMHLLIQKLRDSTVGKITSWTTFALNALFSAILYIAQYYCYLLSLRYTTGASALAIFNASVALVYLLTLFFTRDQVALGKLLAVIMCILGAIMICLSNTEKVLNGRDDESWIGDALAAVSCTLYSIYVIHYQYVIKKPHLASICAYMSLVGVFDILLLLVFPILHHTQLEVWSLPSDKNEMWLSLGLSLSIFVSNLFIWIGAPFTSPLFVSISHILAVPISFGVDLVLKHWQHQVIKISALGLCGTLIIALGFCFLKIKLDIKTICGKKKSHSSYVSS
ncbi:solute carrier family 35 member F5-like [Planoprotostelium fungivorum]|uniref:Solute carrier family 35 member F5-like n=1 Tax=Planoprotostelium fungivorum TaxID=1890364 RepID=A0A2P6N5M4_9EUKA|nr:solute carrier family 35 member F5-like [Planoprotostelium fungivorum]